VLYTATMIADMAVMRVMATNRKIDETDGDWVHIKRLRLPRQMQQVQTSTTCEYPALLPKQYPTE
jgi:hypothetical protein